MRSGDSTCCTQQRCAGRPYRIMHVVPSCCYAKTVLTSQRLSSCCLCLASSSSTVTLALLRAPCMQQPTNANHAHVYHCYLTTHRHCFVRSFAPATSFLPSTSSAFLGQGSQHT